MSQPLKGLRVLDFSTLLPGPLASLILAEAGAEVIKIERPGRGDEMRSYVPRFGEDSVNFALLNRGKRSVAIDLKAAGAVDRLAPLIASADVVLEQFRPGVMDRLGLGYGALSAVNPRLIYCAITGYGQHGPRVDVAAHDLNFIAEAGMLGLSAGADGAPILPPALIADIAGGTYPAVLNILLALRERDRTGKGSRLDIAMADNVFTFMYWALGNAHAAGQWPQPGGELVTGGSPRYNIYRTRDDRFIGAAPLEDKFWATFCEVVGVPTEARDDARDPAATRACVAALIALDTADGWRARFEGREVCCSVVATLAEALVSSHFAARGIFSRSLQGDGRAIAALPVPVDEAFRAPVLDAGYPALGEGNDLLAPGQGPS